MANPRYSDASKAKAGGVNYTPEALGDFVARQMAPHLATREPHGPLRILDPAAGDGALLRAFLRCPEITPPHHVYGLDTDGGALARARQSLANILPTLRTTLAEGDFLASIAPPEDLAGPAFLGTPFDAVIANPPYVRTQVLGKTRTRELAARFRLKGRVDLAYAFILAIAEVLRPGGVAGIITSNRFMTTKAGSSLRARFLELFELHHVWDLGDTKLFDASVLPCVLIATRRSSPSQAPPSSGTASRPSPRFTSIYSAPPVPPSALAPSHDHPLDALDAEGFVRLKDGRCFEVRQGILNATDGEIWRLANPENDTFLNRVAEHTWKTFEDIGPIRVGIKTTADAVFIRSDWEEACDGEPPELLRPLITHHVAGRFRGHTPKREVLYPHGIEEGKRAALNLTHFPRSRTYLEAHRPRLTTRRYLLDAGRQWYELWVPQDPAAWSKPKLVFRDICPEPVVWIDLDGAVVNGDCYWMALFEGLDEDLLWLAMAVANSTFAEQFYDVRFHNKLYARRRRWVTQYLRHFPLPAPNSEDAREAVTIAKRLYARDETDPADLDALVWKLFGLAKP